MVDKVKPLKTENSVDGTEDDVNYTELDPTEDYVAAKGIALENSNSRLIDLDVEGNIQFKDASHTSPVSLKSITDKPSDMSEPTGFVNRTDSVMSFNASTRTLSISPAVTSFAVYVSAKKLTITTTLTKQIPNTSGSYFFFIDETGTLDYLPTFDISILTSKAYTAYVLWDSVAGIALSYGEERHGITMDGATHRYLHTTRGTQLISGASVGYTVGDGSSDTHAKISISDAVISDEDIVVQIANNAAPSAAFQQKLSSVAEIPVYYRVGAVWKKDSATQFPVKQGTSRIKYNKNTTGVWSTEDVSTNGYFAVYYIFATTNIVEPIIALMGQDEYVSQDDADARSGWYSLNFGDLPAQEMKLLYSVMLQTSSAFSNTPKAAVTQIRDLRFAIDREVSAASLNTDHSNLSGLGSDDHLQYLPVTGTRPMIGNLDMGSHNVNNVGTVNGVTVESHKSRHQTGGADAIPVVTTSVDGLMSATDKTKLNSVESGATANDTNANLRDRSTHTGTQLAATISDFTATVLATILAGISFSVGTAVTAADSVLVAIGKLQKQITDLGTSKYDASNPSSYETTTQLNARDTANRSRSNHTGTQLAGTISDFATIVLATTLNALSLATGTDIVATDSILVAFGKLQKQISTNLATFTAHEGAGGAVHAAVTTLVNGFMSANDKTKLDGIATGATVNSSDATLLARANHTGTQAASTISDFTTAVQAVTIDAAKIDGGSVSNLEFSYLDGVTSAIQGQIDTKVDKIVGKGLSTQDYTTLEQSKLAGIATGATANDTNANLRDRTTHTGNETALEWNESVTPAAPTLGIKTYVKDVAGRQMFGQIGKSGVDYTFQPFIARNPIGLFIPVGNATTSTAIGLAATANGTATARTVATTSFFTRIKRLGYVSATTTNSSSGVRSNNLQYSRGAAADVGGFTFIARFGISDGAAVANARLFVGMTGAAAVIGNVNPSTQTSIFGVGADSTDTNLQLMFNDNTANATRVDLGADFPVNTRNTDWYEVIIVAKKNSSTMEIQVTNLTTGITSSTSQNTNLPLATQLLTWQLWRHNGGTALAVGLDVGNIYIESDN